MQKPIGGLVAIAAIAAASFYALAMNVSTGNAAGSGSNTKAGSAMPANGLKTAVLAGGCFWCLEEAMDKVAGVKSTTSGYVNGHVKNPTYRQVSAGGSGHTEAVKVVYDPKLVTFSKILDAFWRNIDPLRANAQFCDRGSQYRAGIYFLNDAQKKAAEQTKAALVSSKRFDQPIVTEIAQAGTFYPAEGYHQDYYMKNPLRYKYYKYSCGRAQRLEELWGPPMKKSS